MKSKEGSRVKRVALILVGLLLLLCLGGAAVSLVTNRNLPTEALQATQLSDVDKARLAEIDHLRQMLGNAAWPGWGDVDIPLIVYNDAYTFLVGYADPPPGWVKVPQEEQRGGPWRPVSDDAFRGETYYRQRLSGGVTPEAFTVLVGDRWAASLHTREAMRVTLAHQFRDMLPGGVREALPYGLAAGVFLRNSDSYVGAMLHEAFHAFQGLRVPERLLAAERSTIQYQNAYPSEEASFVEDWQTELELLQAAVRAEETSAVADLARQFLTQRERRRAAAGLSDALVAYEQQREWLEGLALYNELDILRQAYNDDDYRPVEGMVADPEFDGYDTFEQRWDQEVGQIGRMAANDGDGRFYYSGMAQAALLDRLLPEWKAQSFEEDVFLEYLLATAVLD